MQSAVVSRGAETKINSHQLPLPKRSSTDSQANQLARSLFACTSFRIPGENNITARSMEFPENIPWSVIAWAPGAQVTSTAPNNQPGLAWTSQYGIVGFGVAGVKNLLVEGMNTTGLTVSAQTLDATGYQTGSEESSALAVSDFIAWALGNFASCADVAAAIGSVSVWGNTIPGLGEQPLHFAFSDAQGNNGVVEFLNGESNFYNNPISVLTNDPPFTWHVYNMQFSNVQNNVDPQPTTINGIAIPTQYSTGSYGLPGGFDAVSRFTKIAWTIGKLNLPSTTEEAQQLAWHLLNMIDRPSGTTLKVLNGENLYETTQWTVVRDHLNLTIDIRTYTNPKIYRLSVKALLENLTQAEQKSTLLSTLIPVEYNPELLTF